MGRWMYVLGLCNGFEFWQTKSMVGGLGYF